VPSPFGSSPPPILKYIRQAQRQLPGRKIAVAIAEVVANHWYQYLLHNHRSTAFKGLLLVQGNRPVVMVSVRSPNGRRVDIAQVRLRGVTTKLHMFYVIVPTYEEWVGRQVQYRFGSINPPQ
jgi:hypothetical protein